MVNMEAYKNIAKEAIDNDMTPGVYLNHIYSNTNYTKKDNSKNYLDMIAKEAFDNNKKLSEMLGEIVNYYYNNNIWKEEKKKLNEEPQPTPKSPWDEIPKTKPQHNFATDENGRTWRDGKPWYTTRWDPIWQEEQEVNNHPFTITIKDDPNHPGYEFDMGPGEITTKKRKE